jgi:thiol-disulfide isomerase/thioredoxin
VFATVIGLVVVVLVAVVIVVAGGGDDGSSGTKGGKTVEIASKISVTGTPLPTFSATGADAAVGRAAPRLEGVGFDDASVTVGGATGKPYALAFLAHWCPHCQAEVPRLVELAKTGGTSGVAMTAIATGTSSAAPNYPPSAWLARESWPDPVLVDTRAQTAARAYGLDAYPYFVFVDAAGKVAGRVSGEVTPGDLTRVFQALAAGEQLPLPGVGASSAK